jgi:hypothetical protein
MLDPNYECGEQWIQNRKNQAQDAKYNFKKLLGCVRSPMNAALKIVEFAPMIYSKNAVVV